MTQHDGGKGDKQITPTDKEQFDKNWDAIFKKTMGEHLVKETFKGDTGGVPLLKEKNGTL
jgi:hypothetical protein